MSATRSGLESEVASIMRALRERGLREAAVLSRRLESGLPQGRNSVPGLRRIATRVTGATEAPRAGRRTERGVS